MKIVLDANVFIAALLKNGGTAFQAIQKAMREHNVIIPDQFIRDLYSFMEQAQKKGVKIDPATVLRELAFLQERNVIQVIPTKGTLAISPHEADNRYIEAAVLGKAQVILTGDKDLTAQEVRKKIKEEYGISVLPPQEFVRG